MNNMITEILIALTMLAMDQTKWRTR